MKPKIGFFPLLSKLGKDEHASILVQATFYIIVVLGMIGLALDGGRFLNLNNYLKNLADASALAAANQMDGSLNSLTYATTAANNIATSTSPNTPKLPWYDTSGVRIQSINFYQTLADVDSNNPTTDPKLAHFVKVTTGSWQTAPWFVTAVSVLPGNIVSINATSATAVAEGNSYSNCVVTQSFICNPFEASSTNPGNSSNFISTVAKGTMMRLVAGAGAPGNWGLLQPPGTNGNPNNQQPFWALSSLGSGCTGSDSPVEPDTGNVAKFAVAGMNVRFDSPVANSGDLSLSAPIVISGFKPSNQSGTLTGNNCNREDPLLNYQNPYDGHGINAKPPGFDPANYSATCNAGTSTTYSCPLPRDRVMTVVSPGNANWAGVEMGNGPNQTDLAAYWNNHHTPGSMPAGSLPSGGISRYEIYKLEAAGAAPFTAASDAAEPHGPTCVNSTLGTASRRVINVAIADCTYWSINGASNPLPPIGVVARFFMTEPAQPLGKIYGEFIDATGVNGNDSEGNTPLHKIVRLVR